MSKIYYIGLDVHKDSIAVAIAPSDSTEIRKYRVIGGTLDALDKLVKKLTQPGIELRFVYEAGPRGYVIYRHLKERGFHCEVAAPSLIPKKASDRVKTDARDAGQLAGGFVGKGSSRKPPHHELRIGCASVHEISGEKPLNTVLLLGNPIHLRAFDAHLRFLLHGNRRNTRRASNATATRAAFDDCPTYFGRHR